MATFLYKTIEPDMRVRWRLSRFPFNDWQALTAFLERSGATVVRAIAMPAPIEAVFQSYYRALGRRVPSKDLVEFLRNIGVMLRAGLPFGDVVHEAAATTDHKDLRRVSHGVAMAVASGLGAHAAMSRYADVFPAQMLHIIRVGEERAELGDAFMLAADHVKRIDRLKVDIRKALIYPVIALVAVLAATLFWLYYAVPAMMDLYRQMGVGLPRITVLLLSATETVRQHTFETLMVVALVAVIVRIVYVSHRGFRHACQKLTLRLPVIGKASLHANVASFSEHFAMLLKAGVNSFQALGVVADTLDNEVYRQAVLEIQAGIQRGNGLAVQLRRRRLLFPGMLSRMVATGEQTGTLAEQLGFVADEYASRMQDTVDRVKTLIEPVAIILVGLLLVVIVFAMFFPVYNLILQSSGMEAL